MNHTEIINKFIEANGYVNYLEIGVRNKDDNFNLVQCASKFGVDPDPHAQADFVMTSDDFFEKNFLKYDVVWVDGLHHRDQVLRDIKNSIKWLRKGGVILCHDLNPGSVEVQEVPQKQEQWMGDCWKAWVDLRSALTDWEMFVLNTDCGIGVIRKGHNELLEVKYELTYENLKKNRVQWLNLVHENYCIFKHGNGVS